MDVEEQAAERGVVGGVDTHKDLHVAAVVDAQDRVLGSRSFPTTRQGYKQMLAWMRSFGHLQRIGVEATGTYGAGLLRFMQSAGVEVLEVTTPDKHDRRRRGKNDELDAQNAAHAAFAGRRTVTPKTRDGMIESLRVLKACRKTAVAARRIALQMIQNTIVCAPDEVRETLRHMTRMQLVRTLAACRPDLTDFRNVASAYRITLKSRGRRYLELHDEIADLDVMIGAIVDELAPDLVARNSIGHGAAAQLLLTAGDNSERLQRALPPCVASVRSPRPPARRPVIVSTEGVIGRQTARCTSSPLDGFGRIREPKPTWPSGPPRAIPNLRSSASSNVTSPVLLDHAAKAGDQPGPVRRLTNRRASAAANTPPTTTKSC
jgi:transposase